MVKIYPSIFHPNDDGSITVTFPDLPGCTTEGKSLPDALRMAREGLALYLDTQDLMDMEIPSPSSTESIAVDHGEYVRMIDADPKRYHQRRT